MAYNNIPFKASRGVAAYVAAHAPAGLEEVFAHKSSGYRAFPNVTVLVTSFSEELGNPGCWHVNLLVSIRTACVPAVAAEYASEALVGAIVDLFELAVGVDRSALADLITAAGRALAANERDADMAFFKVDSIHPLPNATSAVEKDEKTQCWVDDFPFELVVRATEATEPD